MEKQSPSIDIFAGFPSELLLLVGIILATIGWLYAARRRRTVMRKQHTFDALMAATFQRDYQDALNACREWLGMGQFPDLNDDENANLRIWVRFLMNHYEFLAAGIRNGDIDEKLLRDSERGTVIRLFETADDCGYVTMVRDKRKRRTIFEHLEWLYERWEENPAPWWQRAFERVINRPLYHHQSRRILFVAIIGSIAVLAIWVATAHL